MLVLPSRGDYYGPNQWWRLDKCSVWSNDQGHFHGWWAGAFRWWPSFRVHEGQLDNSVQINIQGNAGAITRLQKCSLEINPPHQCQYWQAANWQSNKLSLLQCTLSSYQHWWTGRSTSRRSLRKPNYSQSNTSPAIKTRCSIIVSPGRGYPTKLLSGGKESRSTRVAHFGRSGGKHETHVATLAED